MTMEDFADGFVDVIGYDPEEGPAFIPSLDLEIQNEAQIIASDEREITIRRSVTVITPGQTISILDQKEKGIIRQILLKASTSLPDGTTGADPGDLVLHMQLDGETINGYEPITLTASAGGQVDAVSLGLLSDLNLPADGSGHFFLTRDSTTVKVAMFKGPKAYRNRVRLLLTNRNASTNLAVDFIEIQRFREQAGEPLR